MQILTSGTNTENRIGQRYEVISTPSQTRDGQTLKYGSSSLEIQVSITSTPSAEWSSQLNQNIIPFLQCLKLLNILFNAYPEGLKEASETLGSIVEYHQENQTYLRQRSLPQELNIITGSILPSEVRPPLILDFE